MHEHYSFAGLAVLSFHITNIGLLLCGLPTQACPAAPVCLFPWSMLEATDSWGSVSGRQHLFFVAFHTQ